MPGSSRRHKTADSSREAPPPQSGWTQEQRRHRRARMEAAAEVPLSAPLPARGTSAIRCSRDDNVYRDRLKRVQILLSRTQAGPGREVKQKQEETSSNHVHAL